MAGRGYIIVSRMKNRGMVDYMSIIYRFMTDYMYVAFEVGRLNVVRMLNYNM